LAFAANRGAREKCQNESFSDRRRCALRIGDSAHATGRCDACVAAGSCRRTNRRHRSGARPRPWSRSRSYGTRRSGSSLRMVAWTPSWSALKPARDFERSPWRATSFGVNAELR
jgi:hypothetical protein